MDCPSKFKSFISPIMFYRHELPSFVCFIDMNFPLLSFNEVIAKVQSDENIQCPPLHLVFGEAKNAH